MGGTWKATVATVFDVIFWTDVPETPQFNWTLNTLVVVENNLTPKEDPAETNVKFAGAANFTKGLLTTLTVEVPEA